MSRRGPIGKLAVATADDDGLDPTVGAGVTRTARAARSRRPEVAIRSVEVERETGFEPATFSLEG